MLLSEDMQDGLLSEHMQDGASFGGVTILDLFAGDELPERVAELLR
jgi:predicted nucleic acid-binding protein